MKSCYIASTEKLFNLENIDSTVKQYRNDNNVEDKIYAVLAVDAVSLTPEICVTKSGFTTGLLQKELLALKVKPPTERLTFLVQYQNS